MSKEPDAFDRNDRIPLAKELEMEERDTDTLYREEIQSLQRESDIQRLSHRMTLLFLLVPALLLAVFVFSYIDLRGQLKEAQSTGEKEVQALSQDVVGRVTSLLGQHQSLKDGLEARLSTVEKGLKKATARLDKERQEIKALAAEKVDKAFVEQTTQKGTEALAEKVAALKREILLHKAALQTLAEKLEKELDEGANAVATFQSDLRIQGEQVNAALQTLEGLQKKALDMDSRIRRLTDGQEAKNADFVGEKRYRKALEQKVDALEAEITWVEKQLKLKREKKNTPQKNQETLSPPPINKDSENIIEQDIPE